MLNLEYLQLFVRVAATHNISKAGAELNLSSAVASARLSKLEESLGVRLIHRTTRKVSLTDEGIDFYPHAKEVLDSVGVAMASLSVANSQPTGNLRITAPTSFGNMHLMPDLDKFMQAYPGLSVELRLTDAIVDMIEGGFDIAIRNAELKDSGFIARKLAIDKRIICASPAYLEQHGTPRELTDLHQHQCINLIGNDHWSFKTKNGPVTIKTTGHFKTDSGEAVCYAGVKGMGIIMCATWIAHEHIKRGELVEILADYPLDTSAAIWAVYPSAKLVAPKVRAFIDFFSAKFTTPPYWDQNIQS